MLSSDRCRLFLLAVAIAVIAACGSGSQVIDTSSQPAANMTEYLIGPGDQLQVFVWRNPDLSIAVPVRPDGKISTPLVEDMPAVGKSPTQLARDMEVVLSEFVKSPKVNIIVRGFVGTFDEQVRVVGKAAKPQALSYRDDLTLLDVMIEVGGLGEGAAGNRTKIIRRYSGETREIDVRVDDLLYKGKISENVALMPGDVIIIPQSRF